MYIIHICLHEIKRIPNLSALLLATSLHYKHNAIELSRYQGLPWWLSW